MRRGGLVSAGQVVRSWRFGAGVDTDRMVILNQVWEKEAGHLSRFWSLSGVRRGVLYVKTSSPAAAQELQMRSQPLVRALNKYFKRAWIKGIRTTCG